MVGCCEPSLLLPKLLSLCIWYWVIFFGGDYGFACPDTIQIKGSVCHLNIVDLVA